MIKYVVHCLTSQVINWNFFNFISLILVFLNEIRKSDEENHLKFVLTIVSVMWGLLRAIFTTDGFIQLIFRNRTKIITCTRAHTPASCKIQTSVPVGDYRCRTISTRNRPNDVCVANDSIILFLFLYFALNANQLTTTTICHFCSVHMRRSAYTPNTEQWLRIWRCLRIIVIFTVLLREFHGIVSLLVRHVKTREKKQCFFFRHNAFCWHISLDFFYEFDRLQQNAKMESSERSILCKK